MMVKKGIYQHFMGNLYELIDVANHSETLEKMAVYRALYGDQELWVRPLAMWEELVEHKGKSMKRFECVAEAIEVQSHF